MPLTRDNHQFLLFPKYCKVYKELCAGKKFLMCWTYCRRLRLASLLLKPPDTQREELPLLSSMVDRIGRSCGYSSVGWPFAETTAVTCCRHHLLNHNRK